MLARVSGHGGGGGGSGGDAPPPEQVAAAEAGELVNPISFQILNIMYSAKPRLFSLHKFAGLLQVGRGACVLCLPMNRRQGG